MEERYLIDSNTVIDYLGNKLPQFGASFIDNLPAVISVITRIEILGWYNATSEQMDSLQSFVHNAIIYPLAEHHIQQTIFLRQQYKIKLPDAIIAATAISERLTLITHNTDDFKKVPNLKLLDRWEMK